MLTAAMTEAPAEGVVDEDIAADEAALVADWDPLENQLGIRTLLSDE